MTYTQFQKVVQKSRALTSEQKDLLLSGPEWPEEFQQSMAQILRQFDENSILREAYLKGKLHESYTKFEQQVDALKSEEKQKQTAKQVARQTIDGLFPRPVA